jgi:putative ABC transport system permease protein
VLAALILTRWLASLLYGIKPGDPITFTATAVLMIAVSLAACMLPAVRACRVDPVVVLHQE